MKNKFKNYGVILGKSSPTTYIAGSIPFEERNPSGDWTPFLPPGEWQKSDNGDSMSCVTFSALNSIETQEKFLTGNQVNYSDRWIAKMSGTTPNGNYLDKVAETIRTYGLVLESSYPTPEKYTWSEYHADIPADLMAKLLAEGAEWKKKWDIKYEETNWGLSYLKQQLKQSPPQVVVPGHAVENHAVTTVAKIFDSYAPFIKDVPGQYSSLQYGLKIVLYKREQAIPDSHLLIDIKFGDVGRQVEKLINALVANGWIEVKGFDPLYDAELAQWVFKFQLANLPRNSWSFWWTFFYYKGKLVDAKTREILNKALK